MLLELLSLFIFFGTNRSWEPVCPDHVSHTWLKCLQIQERMYKMFLIRCLFNSASQWRIWCREDCQHQTGHPVLCDNRSFWRRQERTLIRQNAGNLLTGCHMERQKLPLVLMWLTVCSRERWKIKSFQPIRCWKLLGTPRPWGTTTRHGLWVSALEVRGFIQQPWTDPSKQTETKEDPMQKVN